MIGPELQVTETRDLLEGNRSVVVNPQAPVFPLNVAPVSILPAIQQQTENNRLNSLFPEAAPHQPVIQNVSPFPNSPIPRSPIPSSPTPRSPIPRSPIPRSPITRSPIIRSPITRSPITRSPITRSGFSVYFTFFDREDDLFACIQSTNTKNKFITRILLVCTRVLLVCYSYVLVCTRVLLVCTRMLLVCTRILLVCYSYVLVCYSYVLVCTCVLLVCYSYVLVWCFSHNLKKAANTTDILPRISENNYRNRFHTDAQQSIYSTEFLHY